MAFESVEHTPFSANPRGWTAMGGITLGLGIWSMHFIGMMAWHPPFPLYYSVVRTVVSALVACAACFYALHIVLRTVSERAKLISAIFVGFGISAMHYVGMSALSFSAPVMWDNTWIILSIAISITSSWAAMELLGQSGSGIKTLRRQFAASLIIGVAICGMHYAGMHAMMLDAGTVSLNLPGYVSGYVLARAGVGIALVLTLGLLIVTYRDKATWIQMASNARLEAQRSAQQLERMASAGRLAASVEHEINNPLEAVMNLIYLTQSGEVGESERQYLGMAEKELKRIAAITNHTLKFYRQPTAPAPASIPELFDSALTLFQSRLHQTGIAVERTWPESLPPVTCREGEIRQVIANLVSNAIDAMPKGGTLRLAISVAEQGLRAEVADTGPGIPPEIREKILEPFFTTKGIGGTGLGLSISSEIIARHGGRFSFETVRDGHSSGTRFHFFLPYLPAEAIFQER